MRDIRDILTIASSSELTKPAQLRCPRCNRLLAEVQAGERINVGIKCGKCDGIVYAHTLAGTSN